MFNHFKKAALVLALASASMSAHAVQADITVWADVDPTLALLKADGTPLTDVVEMSYRPGTAATAGLTPWTERVRVFSNDIAKDITVSLGSDAALLPESTGGAAAKVDLTVSLNGIELGTAGKDFTAATLYPGSDMPGASKAMDLRIEQKTPGIIATGGKYKGIVSVIMVLKS